MISPTRAGQALAEANAINKSLSFLEQAVHALARKGAHVPFRQSRLTAVLAEALGGNCRTTLIANVWNERSHLDETLSTLRCGGAAAGGAGVLAW